MKEELQEYYTEAEVIVVTALRLVKRHFTVVPALITAAVAGVVIFIVQYLKQYNSWDGFDWPKKAAVKLLVFCCVEAAVFLLIRGLVE